MNTIDSFTTQSGDVFKLIQLSPEDDLATLVWKPIAWLPGGYAIVTTMRPDPSEAYGRMFLGKLAEDVGGDFGGPYYVFRLVDDQEDEQLWLGSDKSPAAHIVYSDDDATWVDEYALGIAQEFTAFREAVAEVKRLLFLDVERREHTTYVIVDHKLNPVRTLQSAKVIPLHPKVAKLLSRMPKRYDYDENGILQELQ